MENYRKGRNLEEELTREKIPVPDLPQNFTWMKVNGGSKIRNLLDVAFKGFVEHGAVVWTGSGASISKAISCAEILKRKHRAHQITKICYRKSEEFWEPLLPELDELVVERDEPTIHILLSRDPLNTNELGYQAPGEIDQSFKEDSVKNPNLPRNSNSRNRKKPYTSNPKNQVQRGNPHKSSESKS